MTTAYNAEECARLIAEAREDHGIARNRKNLRAMADQLEAVHRLLGEERLVSAELDSQVHDLTAERDSLRQQLEAAFAEVQRLHGQTYMNWSLREEVERLTAALRVIHPVYRAVEVVSALLERNPEASVQSFRDAARAALTPDLLAVLERMGTR